MLHPDSKSGAPLSMKFTYSCSIQAKHDMRLQCFSIQFMTVPPFSINVTDNAEVSTSLGSLNKVLVNQPLSFTVYANGVETAGLAVDITGRSTFGCLVDIFTCVPVYMVS